MDVLVPTLIAVGFLLLVALLVVAVVHGVRKERRRVEALRAWANAHGWRMIESPQTEWTSRMPGRNRRGVTRALVGVQQGHQVSVAEYRYTETTTSANNTTSSTTHHFIVVAVHLDRPGATIAVQRRGALSKLGRSVFGDRATALGDERFDSQWRVNAQDAATVRGLVGPALVAEHVAGRVPHWSIQETELVTYERGRLTDPSRIPELVAPLVRVAGLLGR